VEEREKRKEERGKRMPPSSFLLPLDWTEEAKIFERRSPFVTGITPSWQAR
jgi:hypothetical protein